MYVVLHHIPLINYIQVAIYYIASHACFRKARSTTVIFISCTGNLGITS